MPVVTLFSLVACAMADDLTFPEGLLLRLVPLGLGDGGLGLSGRLRLGARPFTVLGRHSLCPSMHCRV